MRTEFTNDVRLGGTVRKFDEIWVKIENYHGEMVWKRRKKKKIKKEETNQKVYTWE